MQNQYNAVIAEMVSMEKEVASKGAVHRALSIKLRHAKIEVQIDETSHTAEAISELQVQKDAAHEAWMVLVRERALASYYVSALHGLMLIETGERTEDFLVEAYVDIKDYLMKATTDLRKLDQLNDVEFGTVAVDVIDLGNIFMPDLNKKLKELVAA